MILVKLITSSLYFPQDIDCVYLDYIIFCFSAGQRRSNPQKLNNSLKLYHGAPKISYILEEVRDRIYIFL